MNRKMVLEVVEVDNPLYVVDHHGAAGNPKRAIATRNVRSLSPVEKLGRRGSLKERHVWASNKFLELWEIRSGVRSSRSLERSDTPYRGSISEAVIDAGRELEDCKDLLKDRMYLLVCEVCGQQKFVWQTTYVRTSPRTNKGTACTTAMDYLRDALDDLAQMWGRTRYSRVVDTDKVERA